MVLDPDGYHRFDSFVDIAISIEPQRAADALAHLVAVVGRIVQRTRRERSGPDDRRCAKPSNRCSATPEVEGDIELVQPKVYYQFADPNLEALKPLQKQLLRMGPQNLARIKGYLMQVKGHL